jgi:hypothetical protein
VAAGFDDQIHAMLKLCRRRQPVARPVVEQIVQPGDEACGIARPHAYAHRVVGGD